MSKVNQLADPGSLTTISDLARFLSIAQKQTNDLLTGNVEFGINILSTLVTASLVTPGIGVPTRHNLPRKPQGFILAGSNAAVRVYNTTASDDTFIYPIGDAVANVIILVF